MQLRYNFRLYPTPAQRQSLARAFGCARVVFNDGLRLRVDAHRAGLAYVPDGVLLKTVTTDAKLTPERAWLTEVSAVVLQQAVADLNRAYRAFFDSVVGRRKGARVGHPRFRSKKDSRQSVRFTNNSHFRITDTGELRLPKIGDVEVRWSRQLPTAPSSVTVTKDACDRYFASFVVEVAEVALPSTEAEVGIDQAVRTGAPSHRQVRAHVPDVLDVWCGGRSQIAVGAEVDLWCLQDRPRPGPQCSTQHPRARTCREVKRLWRGRKTWSDPGRPR